MTKNNILLIFFISLSILIGCTIILPSCKSDEIDSLKKGNKTFQELMKDGEPAYILDEAQTIARELIPVVEKIAGRKFKLFPAIKIAGKDEYINAIATDIAAQMRNLLKNKSEKEITEMATKEAESVYLDSFSAYSVTNKALYLRPRMIAPFLRIMGLGEKHASSVIRMCIAHELAHALQDQHVDLEKQLSEIKDFEARDSLYATFEGHAEFVQETVGKRLNIDDRVIRAFNDRLYGHMKFEDPVSQMMYKRGSVKNELIYLGGKKFIEYHHAKGGNNRLWEILDNPPRDTSMIVQPETYSDKWRRDPNLASVAESLTDCLGKGRSTAENWQSSKTGMNFLAEMDFKEKTETISIVDHLQSFSVQKYDSVIMNVLMFLCKDPSSARKVDSLTREMSKTIHELIKNSTNGGRTSLMYEDLEGIRADIAYRKTEMARDTGVTESMHISIIRGELGIDIYSDTYAQYAFTDE